MQTINPCPASEAGVPVGVVDVGHSKWRSLSQTWMQLKDYTSCSVRVGVEIEFYLENLLFPYHRELLEEFSSNLRREGILISSVKAETGKRQYEIALCPSHDPAFVAQSIEHLKSVASAISTKYGFLICFAARPYASQPPSALQINVSLVDGRGMNQFAKQPGVESETELMQHSIAGLCELMSASMIFFAPTAESYKRFMHPFVEGPYKFANAPATISWGGNNRTVAIRIPTSTENPDSRHLEHRVPGSDADPALVIASVLAGMSHGIERCLPLQLEKVWGDASELTGSTPLLHSLDSAVAVYRNCLEIQTRMNLTESMHFPT